ncbi:aldose epimerase family protein [Salisediminibacterium halotolerans]|uniref:Aldose 1-epimerase n=1 Tax=Salisediminibacterium halotolerans TaxID=517425 RepID=A0A1H9QL36_9BACI|nr:aldose epimerase family protein [Salisediminibacterium haloalkalitolerans]SER61182.1 aldose 1-epimerase [Salisediminibacterium haloalkalitolerans]
MTTTEAERFETWTIENGDGMRVTAMNQGATLLEVAVPDREGELENVVLAFDDRAVYKENPGFLGAVVGRTAGRIKDGRVTLGEEEISLAKSEGDNHLHGGERGFSHRVFSGKKTEIEGDQALVFSYLSADGEEGYPGNLELTVVYRLTEDNALAVEYSGKTDADTFVNVTNHSYFNLSGNARRTIGGHTLMIGSSRVLELGEASIPTGDYLLAEQHAPFDFTEPKPLQPALDADHPQVELVGGGVDHPYVLDQEKMPQIELADPESGRKMSIATDDPAVVCYTGNQLEGSPSIHGQVPPKHMGICLETQSYPDFEQHEHFPKPLLKAGESFTKKTMFTFSVI